MTLYLGDKAKSGTIVVSKIPSEATEENEGIVKLATSEEAINGTNDTSAMTPKKTLESIQKHSFSTSAIVQDFSSLSADTVPSTQAVSNNYVKKSGDTMTGVLTVNGAIVSNLDNVNYIARSKSLVKGTTPTDSNKYVGYDWQDKNGQRLAYLGVNYGTDGSKILELQKLDSNLQKFVVNYLTTFVAQPQTSISGNARYNSVCTGYTKGTAPSAYQFGGISTLDKNNVEVATIYSSIDTNNNVTSALWVKQPTASGTAAAAISIWCDNNGNFHTYCGVESKYNNSILTISSHGDNWIKYSDGRLEQWGICTAAQQTITLYQPYKDTNYAVNVTLGANENNNYCPVVADFTTTRFLKCDRGQYWHAIGWWK